MARNCIRISLVLSERDQHYQWKNYSVQKGYGNLSMMIRCIINSVIEKDGEPIDKSLEPIKNALNSLFKLSETINEGVDMLNMRLADNGENREYVKVAREIWKALSAEEMSLPEIVGKLSCSRVAIKEALVLLNDLGVLKTRRPQSEANDEVGDKNE